MNWDGKMLFVLKPEKRVHQGNYGTSRWNSEVVGLSKFQIELGRQNQPFNLFRGRNLPNHIKFMYFETKAGNTTAQADACLRLELI